jgi:hypothetical protein
VIAQAITKRINIKTTIMITTTEITITIKHLQIVEDLIKHRFHLETTTIKDFPTTKIKDTPTTIRITINLNLIND